MALNNFTFAEICQMIIVPAFFDTLKMLLISGVLSTFLGFFVGVVLIITEKGGLCENVIINRILDFIVNTVHSVYPSCGRDIDWRYCGSGAADRGGHTVYGAYFSE